MISRPLPPSLRIMLLRVLVVTVAVIMVAQLWKLQFLQGEGFRLRANENRFRLVETTGQRGVIYDRNGHILVRNRPSFNIAIIPGTLPDDEAEAEAVLKRLEGLIKLSESDLPVHAADDETEETTAGPPKLGSSPPPQFRERMTVDQAMEEVNAGLQGGAYRPVVFAGPVSEETAFAIAEASYELPGVELVIEPVREYLSGTLTSQVLGFMGPIPQEYVDDYEAEGYRADDQVCLSGVELTFEKALRGQNGSRNIEVDVNGREVRT
ncbi:MAG: hypothetical protein KDH08_15295, partial [Anaerolineae bacterium]|nr:hypothetical protein [Anaerolineae bacterium]